MQKLAQLCIRRPVFATMLVLALVVMGLDGYRKLGVDFFPKVEFPIVTITTTLRGAAPEEVESQVTKRIEEAVNTVSGIDDLSSLSAEGISQVFVQFVLDKDPEIAAQTQRMINCGQAAIVRITSGSDASRPLGTPEADI